MNPEKNNAVLVLTWFMGRSEDLGGLIGPDCMFDPDVYYVIGVDAFGNGVSSSPSNCGRIKGSFPEYSIRDMVKAQKRLLTEVLGIERLAAVAGYSMGGMQVFEWLASEPEMVEKAVVLMGTPKPTPHDLLAWTAMLRGLEACRECQTCDPAAFFAPFMSLLLSTPEALDRDIQPGSFSDYLRGITEKSRSRLNLDDVMGQLKAMMSFDVQDRPGESIKTAAGRIKADLLVIGSMSDHIVRPEPGFEFARAAGGDIVKLTGDCGHRALSCQRRRINRLVRDFLNLSPMKDQR